MSAPSPSCVLVASTLLLSSAGCVMEVADDAHGSLDDAGVVGVQSAALFEANPLTPWPADADGIHSIRVCFVRDTVDTCNADPTCDLVARAARFEEELDRSWGVFTNVEFWDFGPCDAIGGVDQPAGAMVVTGDFDPNAANGGRAGVGNDADMTVSLTTGDDLGNDSYSRGLWSGVVIHEVGHALGMIHEQNRDDNFLANGEPRYCYDGANSLPNGIYRTPYYDGQSIMNYCTGKVQDWRGEPLLWGQTIAPSIGDIEGAQVRYGRSPEGDWLRASAAVMHAMPGL